jgi:exodeoxyribonuclease VIII
MDDGYRLLAGVNWSSLKYLRESALLYRYRLGVPDEDTPSMALGRATHALVFEPETFERDFAIWEGGRRQGKEWEAFRDAHVNQTIFKPDEIELAAQMAEAVRRHPLVQPYLTGGLFEHPIRWTDGATGLLCKAKPDWLIAERRILLDLKSARSIDARRFGAFSARLGYHCQLAHYRNGVTAALGWRPERVLIVAVENEPPHDVAVFELDEEALYVGEQEVQELLAMLRACRTADQWPGRYTEEQALQLPAWLFNDDEEDQGSFGLAL